LHLIDGSSSLLKSDLDISRHPRVEMDGQRFRTGYGAGEAVLLGVIDFNIFGIVIAAIPIGVDIIKECQ
jgi:hypothetical protein